MSGNARLRRRDKYNPFRKAVVVPPSASGSAQPGAAAAPTPTNGSAQPNVSSTATSPMTSTSPNNLRPYDPLVSAALEKLEREKTGREAYDEANKLKTKIEEGTKSPFWDKADKVIKWVDQFKSIGDGLASLDPIHAGLPWAGVKFLLSIAVAEKKQRDALITGMDLALELSNRLGAYMPYFEKLLLGMAADNFRDALIKAYVLLLRFLARAFKVYKKNMALRVVSALWQGTEISDFKNDCQTCSDRLANDALQCEQLLSGKDRDERVQWRTDLDTRLRKLDEISRLQTSVDNLHLDFIISKLDSASVFTATANGNEEDLLPTCLDGTRVKLLEKIVNWMEQKDGKSIFWLCGSAGMGKSTISRTVAKRRLKDKKAGASFFFKRGHRERGNANAFFPTIVSQLVHQLNALHEPVAKALEDPGLSKAGLDDQFHKLLRDPLIALAQTQTTSETITIVIDALDECDHNHVRKFITLLSSINSIEKLRMRIFVTSRQVNDIASEFFAMSSRLHDDIFLEKFQASDIEGDLRRYLDDEFSQIRRNWLSEQLYDSTPIDWPTDSELEELVQLSTPLFIFAATICRYVKERSPQERLESILHKQRKVSGLPAKNGFQPLGLIYAQIIDQSLGLGNEGDEEIHEDEAEDITENIEAFRKVVGSIILAAEPLSPHALSKLLDLSVKTIGGTLRDLKSVLSVPESDAESVQTHHLSFREYLVDNKNRTNERFRVDEKQVHKQLADHCLRVLMIPDALRQDICNVKKPGYKRLQITDIQIAQCIPRHVAYACMYWPYHLIASGETVVDNGPAYLFLTKHFLHWLEAMSWLEKYNLIISSIVDLIGITKGDECSKSALFLEDARRFVLKFRTPIDVAPLQVYHSALKFAPSQSIISQTFSGEATALWSLFPETAAHWSPDFLVLEGHEIPVSAIAFSPDGQLIASAGYGGNVRLWSLAGEQLHALEQQQRGEIRYITFCEEGKQIASLDANGDVWFWDVDTWEQVQEYHLHKLGSIDDLGLYDQRAMSSTGHIASIDWRTLWLLDPRREHNQQLSASTMTFIDHPIDDLVDRPDEDVEDMSRGRTDDMIENVSQCGSQWEIVLTAIAFSPDGQLAAGTENGWFMFWASGTNFQPWMNKLHSGRIAHIAFASDGKFATEDNDGYVCVWSYSSGEVSSLWRRKFELDREPMTLGPGGLFVIGSGRTMEVWDIYADVQVGEMSGHRNSVTALAFSLKGQLASASWDKTIRLWTTSSMNGRTAGRKIEVETGYSEVYAFALSSDEAILISGHENGDVRTWDTQTGKESQCFNEACAGVVTAMAFSPDGRAVASTSGDGTVRMWDTDTGKVLRYFQGQSTHVLSVLFSPDGRLIASGSMEGLLLLWDPNTGKALRRCESEGGVWSLAFSPDGEVVVSVHSHHMARFWNAQTGQLLHQWGFEGHNVSQLAVSCNKVIATAASQQWPVQLWDGDTGQLLLELYADDNALMPGRLRFSLDGNILQTNAGTFHLTDALLSVGTTPSLKPAPLGLNKAGDWIQQYGEDTLWIPSEFRSSGILCLCLSHKHFLAIPTATRGMVFFHPKI